MIIDYKTLNERTIGDVYPLPNITDILDQLESAKYFSMLNFASGFHQIPMNPNDVHKTVFTLYGHYQFRRMTGNALWTKKCSGYLSEING